MPSFVSTLRLYFIVGIQLVNPAFFYCSTILPNILSFHSFFLYRSSACNACIARYYYGKSVCPSICLSNAVIVCKTNGYIVIILWAGRDITVVFLAPASLQNSKGNSLSGGVIYTGWVMGEFCKYRFSSRKRYEIGPLYYGSLIGSHR